MSVELDFWKYRQGVKKDDGKIYEAVCCRGQELDCLEELPIDEIISCIGKEFSDWKTVGRENYEKDDRGTFSLSTTSQSVRIDCYDMSGEDMIRLVELMKGFDCPLYDPNLGERFDSGSMGLFALLS